MTCVRCGTNLETTPIIDVENRAHCYACAKVAVPELQKNRKEIAAAAYQAELIPYNVKKVQYDTEMRDWAQRRNAFVTSGTWGNAQFLGFALVFALLGCILGPPGFLIGGIVGFVIACNISGKKENELRKQFEAGNPEPKFNLKEPQFPVVAAVKFEVRRNRHGNFPRSRDQILKRDSYSCQTCRKKKTEEQLEVHHIIPRAEGGIDCWSNLITLCLECHDSERWFGHIRAYPTTKKMPLVKPKRRRSLRF